MEFERHDAGASWTAGDVLFRTSHALVDEGRSSEGIDLAKAMLDNSDSDRSVWFALDPLPSMDGNPITTNTPITTPNTEAMMKPDTNHPTLRVGCGTWTTSGSGPSD